MHTDMGAAVGLGHDQGVANNGVMTAVERREVAVVAGDAERRRLVRVSVAAGIWALWYTIYRGYYAAGGTAFLPGTIREGSQAEFRLVNLVGAVIIGVAAVLPVAILPLWPRRWPRRMLLALCWVVAVGCCMHALVAMTQRVLSLTGTVDIDYPPMWASVNHRVADLQDLFFNEPWFLVEGLAFGVLGWIGLGAGRARRWWTLSAVTAIVALLVLGVLVVAGVVGRTIIL
ncbi:hypothetical protein [Micromonospora sp. NPDC093277]|uniref:hypothetical protein n=1 Tax=Micromonospora sp. NPDC093277 TaxID=3364291 RepID=UPI00380527A5